ncbi:MAG: DUF5320 domain-containing protein [Candidatus Krumholzibacteriota bacterium]|nr:DUF5320 domain-containing protein [Candidatus Krumholzibacteriota bacterium]
MPGGDRTGPAGMGPMTGRGLGYCAGYAQPGFAQPFPGRGFGFGRGMGFGFRGGRGRHWGVPYYGNYAPVAAPYGAYPARPQEIEVLREQAEYFERSLAEIRKRIEELEEAEAK